MIDIINKPWNYRFFKKDSDYYLLVSCGSVAVFEITIKLNKHEMSLYKEYGADYINDLVKKIQFSPSEYSERNIENIF